MSWNQNCFRKEVNGQSQAKKRQLIDQRLQAKLRKETDSVRRAEEAKKDKTAANRKEEELQLKDSIVCCYLLYCLTTFTTNHETQYKLRRKRLPILANFLFTSDVIPSEDSPPPPSANPLAPIPRSHPPPLCYLPAILTPAQETFISRRKAEVCIIVKCINPYVRWHRISYLGHWSSRKGMESLPGRTDGWNWWN